MKRGIKVLIVIVSLFLTYNVNALKITQKEYENYNITRSYIVGEYIFDLSKHNPTLRDLMLASQSLPTGEATIIEIKIAKNINGVLTKEYRELLSSQTLTSFPTLDVKYIYQGEIMPDNPSNEKKIVLEKKSETVAMANYQIPVVKENNKQVLKVLILEIDPILTKGAINGKNCKGLNASACLGQNKQQAINELIVDLEESSHNNIDVRIVQTIKDDKFARYKRQVPLIDGTKSNLFDESTWLDIMKNGWYEGILDSRVEPLYGTYSFDYDYYIDKYALISKRNNNEFDEVWIVNVDPAMTYESIMVGKNAYWINGEAIEAECPNFKMMNVSISRPDVNFECFGHASEFLLTKVFSKTMGLNFNPMNWNYNSISINSSNYNQLNLWQKFMLTEYQNSNKNTGLIGVGNIHFSPNSGADYDWNNRSNLNVLSKWQEWENYPNLTNNVSKIKFTPTVYMSKTLNGTNSDARLHHRWWFGLIPYVSGYSKDGYYNNWWKYLYSNDFVTNITLTKFNYTYSIGDKIDNIGVTLTYNGGKKETVKLDNYMNNMSFANKNLFEVDNNGKIYASAKGSTTLTYFRDGISKSIAITIN